MHILVYPWISQYFQTNSTRNFLNFHREPQISLVSLVSLTSFSLEVSSFALAFLLQNSLHQVDFWSVVPVNRKSWEWSMGIWCIYWSYLSNNLICGTDVFASAKLVCLLHPGQNRRATDYSASCRPHAAKSLLSVTRQDLNLTWIT